MTIAGDQHIGFAINSKIKKNVVSSGSVRTRSSARRVTPVHRYPEMSTFVSKTTRLATESSALVNDPLNRAECVAWETFLLCQPFGMCVDISLCRLLG